MIQPTRREFIKTTTLASLGSIAGTNLVATESDTPDRAPRGDAKHCIMIWLGGGACQIDTWDPKRIGDPATHQPGSAYSAIATGIENVQVCEHLSHVAPLLDRGVLLRTVNHNVVDEHAAATNRMHTGRPTTGTTIYPSIGSVVSFELGAESENVPAYIVMGYPSATRGPGFLGAKHGYIYLTDTKSGPRGLKRPADIRVTRQRRREALLGELRQNYEKRNAGDRMVANYGDVSAAAFRMAGPGFMSAFNLAAESASLRNDYGSEFGQRCLLARRLIQRGVRFIEVSYNLNFINGTGWDTHNEGQKKQHVLIQDLDQVLATLLQDLERSKLLDETLIVVSTEFGRPSGFDGRGGRGHHSKAFSVAMFGGGLRTGQAIGTTDELGELPVDFGIQVPDLHATIYAAMGIDPADELYDGERPIPITDGGKPLAQVLT